MCDMHPLRVLPHLRCTCVCAFGVLILHWYFTAAVQGITTAIALQEGLGSPLFSACVAFSVIVMYDAMGVRRHAGKQAEVLNQVGGVRCRCLYLTSFPIQ